MPDNSSSKQVLQGSTLTTPVGTPTKQDNEKFYPLHKAAKDNDIRTAEWLLNKKSTLYETYKQALHEYDEDGLTPLHYTASRNHLELFKLFMQHGAKIQTLHISKTPRTSFHYASMNQRIDVLCHIIRNRNFYKFDMDMACGSVGTALQSSARNNEQISADILIRAGAERGYIHGESAIGYAIYCDNFKILEMLLTDITYEKLHEKDQDGKDYLYHANNNIQDIIEDDENKNIPKMELMQKLEVPYKIKALVENMMSKKKEEFIQQKVDIPVARSAEIVVKNMVTTKVEERLPNVFRIKYR